MKTSIWKKWALICSVLSVVALLLPVGLQASGVIDDPNEGPKRGPGEMDVPTETLKKAPPTPSPSPAPEKGK